MPVKPEAVASYLGLDLEKIEDEKAMKAAFDAAFLRRDVAHEDRGIQDRVFGKINALARHDGAAMRTVLTEHLNNKRDAVLELIRSGQLNRAGASL